MNRFAKGLVKSVGVLLTANHIKSTDLTTDNFFFSKNPFKDLESTEAEIFLWGNGWYQAKPGSLPNFSNFSPKKQIMAVDQKQHEFKVPDLVDLAESEKAILGIDSKGNIWSFDNKKIAAMKDDADLSSHRKSVTTKSGEVKSRKIHSQNILSNIQNSNIGGKAVSIKVVLSNVYVLSAKGKLYKSKLDFIQSGSAKWKEVKSVDNLKQIEGGERHLLMLDKSGSVFAMGDDTHGQCGSGDLNRIFSGPFVSRIVRNPQKIESLSEQIIEKIFVGGNHNFAMSKSGQVFGWGFNNLMQLGHEDEYCAPNSPRLAFFAPVNFNYFFKDHEVKDIALGSDFTLFICKNRANGLTDVFGMGHNSQGQLGSGFPRHIQKMTKLQPLSGFETHSEKGERVPLDLNISCGNMHCMAKGSNGSLLIWGGNQHGQLGNKKRAFSGNPLLFSKFAKKNVKYFKAFGNQSFVNVTEQ